LKGNIVIKNADEGGDTSYMMQLLFLINIIDKESTDSKLDFTKLHLKQTDNCHKYKATKHKQRENHIQ
jgi:hypothetical protein